MNKAARKSSNKSRSKKIEATSQSHQGRWSIVMGLMLISICWTGLEVVESATETRALYQQLDQVQRAQDRLLEEHSRLSLQLGSISSLQEIEEIALNELDMLFPERIERLAP